MKFVSSREIRVNPKPVFEAAEGGDEIVLTSRGKPVALLVGISDENLEETVRLLRRAKAQASVSRMREGSRVSEEEVELEVRAVRDGRTG